jgi:translation initiation factor eIF-2B subunit alpha
VIVTEGRPDSTGINMARQLEKLGVPVTMVLDTGVAYIMERVDMVLMGAEG